MIPAPGRIPTVEKPGMPVENCMAHRATVAPKESSPWHDATVASHANVVPPATLERLANVKGELRLPNTIVFSLFPTLDPFAKARLFSALPSLAWFQARHLRDRSRKAR
jgi:hypothetical protein